MKYLGIDYGTKRVGLATSDDTHTIAFPYKTIPSGKTLLADLLHIIQKEHITKVVLGESKDRNMNDNPVMKGIRRLKEALEKEGIAVDFHPEFYSSAQVINLMGEENKAIDASAAAVILQNYLELQKNI